MIFVTRKEQFSAAHRLYNTQWSDEKNREIFGKCNNATFHGHNYVLEVTVAGEPDPDTGFVIDLTLLKDIIQSEVLDKMDHLNLNLDIDFLSGINPTAENIAIAIWKQLEDKLPKGKLYKIVLHESDKNAVEYRGPQ